MSPRDTSPQERLAELIISIARQEWQNENSTTWRNRETLPKDLRNAFVVFADMGGLCVLDSRGSIRVFVHYDGREIEATDWVVQAALDALGRVYPEVAELVALTQKE